MFISSLSHNHKGSPSRENEFSTLFQTGLGPCSRRQLLPEAVRVRSGRGLSQLVADRSGRSGRAGPASAVGQRLGVYSLLLDGARTRDRAGRPGVALPAGGAAAFPHPESLLRRRLITVHRYRHLRSDQLLPGQPRRHHAHHRSALRRRRGHPPR